MAAKSIIRDRYTLMQADFRDTLAAVAGQADLVLCSPPYADSRTYGMDCNWTMTEYAALGDSVFDALKPGGHALINVDAPVRKWRRLCKPCGRMTSLDACPRCAGPLSEGGTERGFHPWQLQADWAERVGFRVPDRLAFGRMGQVGRPHGRFRNDWEPLLWFQRPGLDPFHDPDAIASKTTPGKRAKQRRYGDERRDLQASEGAYEWDSRLPGTLWDYRVVGTKGTGAPDIEAENHPARWPFKLAEDIIRCFCPPDGLAVDPFTGAGTSCAAAIAHGRRFHGGDLGSRQFDPAKPHLDAVPWVEVADRVMVARLRQQKLFGATHG